jgi:hypothetical protein
MEPEIPEIESSHVNLALLDAMDGHEFEDLVEQLLSKMGFHIEGRKAAADGGIDMVATKMDAIVGGKFIIQCKRFTGSVGNSVIRDLYGVVHSESANMGVLITNSTFTRDARSFAEGKPIELIDGARLQDLLHGHGLLTTTVSSTDIKLSPGVQLLYTQLVRPLANVMAESKKVAAGVVFLPKESVDLNRYQTIVQRHMGQISGFMNTFPALAGPLGTALNDYNPTAETLAELRGHIREMLNMARALLKIQKEAESIVPPPLLATAHPLYLKLAPALLEKLWPFAQVAKDLVEGTFSGSEVNLAIDLATPEIDSLNAELNRIASGQHKPKAGACFIATASFASDLDPNVIQLRMFRDEFLTTNRLGRAFVTFYENTSPPMAKFIAHRNSLRLITRTVLVPFVGLATLANQIRSVMRRNNAG